MYIVKDGMYYAGKTKRVHSWSTDKEHAREYPRRYVHIVAVIVRQYYPCAVITVEK